MSQGPLIPAGAFVAELVQTGEVRMACVPSVFPRDGFIRIRISCTGVCGSDLSTWQGRHPYKRAPTVLGHEFSGVVEALEASTERWSIGDRVCAMAYSPCDVCEVCVAQKPHLCANKATFSHGGWGGSFASHVLARETMLFRLPDAVDDESGALVEPLAIGLHAVRLAGKLYGRSLAIVGTGNIGLACTLAASRLGAEQITCIDVNPQKESLAKDCGAHNFLQAPFGNAQSFDVVILACDYANAIDDSVALTVPGGRVIVVSYSGKQISFAADAMVRKEISMTGSALATRQDFEAVIGWLADGSLNARPMITHRMKVHELETAMRLMAEGIGCIGKIMLTP